jgi:hypothetical protein
MRFWLSIIILFLGNVAQSDPGSQLLIKGSDVPPQQEAIDTGRYQIKNDVSESNSLVKNKVKKRKISSEGIQDDIQKSSESSKNTDNKTHDEAENKIKDENLSDKNKELKTEPNLVDQVKDLVLGNPQPTIELYKEQVHPDDVRLNKLEINVTPGFLYVDSKSNYSFKNFTSASPFAQMGAAIWFTPLLGINGSYGLTTAADINEGFSSNNKTSVVFEKIELAADYRKFFGMSRRSNSVTIGLHYIENTFSPAADNLKRVKSKTNGIGFHFQSRFPIAPSFSWILGAKLEPKLSHQEQDTGINLRSGDSVETSRFGFNFGSELKLSRHHQMILNLDLSTEKNKFSGLANTQDPESLVTPNGVSINNSQIIFSLGYRWGQ